MLDENTKQRIRQEYLAFEQDVIKECLSQYGAAPHHRERHRVHGVILDVSKGSADEVKRLVEIAKKDYRDVLVSQRSSKERSSAYIAIGVVVALFVLVMAAKYFSE